MAFHVEIFKVEGVDSIPGADAIELCRFGAFQSVVKKAQVKPGDYAVYIPEGAIVPDNILQEMDLVGRLGGSSKNRVKPIKLRGCLSQGLVLGPLDPELIDEMIDLGRDVQTELGITKWNPNEVIMTNGRQRRLLGGGDPRFCFAAWSQHRLLYDIENIKRHQNSVQRWIDENGSFDIVCAEKAHGTFTAMCLLKDNSMLSEPYAPEHCPNNLVVSSKGRLEKGNFLLPDGEAGDTVYWKVARALDIRNRCDDTFDIYNTNTVFVLGEILGVQDLKYGFDKVIDQDDQYYTSGNITEENVPFRVFDVYIGDYGQGRYLDDAELDEFCARYNLVRVPILYRGPWDMEEILKVTNGKETITGNNSHIREGVVVRAQKPVMHHGQMKGCCSRVQLKSISPDYLLRSGTEFT
jgi:RNA ligase (TIGR02306 family)